jgi:hypothetical protein
MMTLGVANVGESSLFITSKFNELGTIRVRYTAKQKTGRNKKGCAMKHSLFVSFVATIDCH